MTPEFSRILARAFQGGVDVSLRELITALQFSAEDMLGAALEVGKTVTELGLSLTPVISRGDLDTRRALAAEGSLTIESIRASIEEEEHDGVEFKSTLVCDLRALREAPPRQVKSDGVMHSALKTICAFANSGGGRLLVGVEDNQAICGLLPDLTVMGVNRDGWQNHLRSLINTRFWQGRLVNSFVGVEFLNLDGPEIAVIDVVGRRESTFLKHPREDRHEFFVRQGNRTVSLDMHEFELHVRR